MRANPGESRPPLSPRLPAGGDHRRSSYIGPSASRADGRDRAVRHGRCWRVLRDRQEFSVDIARQRSTRRRSRADRVHEVTFENRPEDPRACRGASSYRNAATPVHRRRQHVMHLGDLCNPTHGFRVPCHGGQYAKRAADAGPPLLPSTVLDLGRRSRALILVQLYSVGHSPHASLKGPGTAGRMDTLVPLPPPRNARSRTDARTTATANELVIDAPAEWARSGGLRPPSRRSCFARSPRHSWLQRSLLALYRLCCSDDGRSLA